jgi:predicted SAM-dependent methyltransferase
MTSKPIRLNIGCGMTPTAGWQNFDNSMSVKLAERNLLFGALQSTGFIAGPQREFVDFCRKNQIRWADATRHIPFADGTVDVVYASHMFEHLERSKAASFLAETRRVLRPGGTLRLAVPNIGYHIARYSEAGDADRFMRETHTVFEGTPGLRGLLTFVAIGPRNHRWMYDGASLAALLVRNGFPDAKELPAGQTGIDNPSPLDLFERMPESVFVEGTRPAT